ncbi:hypothetical protein [Planococcus sp. ISL-110]|uniref:hypothetical protein n=1 Tax=Planococcus sp. ISL-110 TaxID=2819167 RepID=UPI001BE72A34|nr:hypothetical protein [Planococcus sp. ISL-110]MBT2571232.1 hypothetical protein [Planococcus sp. ISL-110]
MKTLFLKMSVPVIALGFVLTPYVDTQAYMAIKNPASEEQKLSYEPGAGVLERLGPYEKQFDALEEDLQALITELDGEETISFEQYQQYQSTLDGLLQELNTLSQEIESESPAINQNFKELLLVQEKMHGIDVK